MSAAARVSLVMRAMLVWLVLAGAACASTPSDYTPQINVVPGAAARSLWIGSKNAGDDAEARPPKDGDAGDPAE